MTRRTGLSREGVEWHTAELMAATPASSRLKPVLLLAASCRDIAIEAGPAD